MNYFSLVEMRCKDENQTAYPTKWVHDRWPSLLAILNPVRERHGSGIHVLSGYRTREYNASIGGAKFSQHVEGRACDLRPVGILPADIAKWTPTHYEIIRSFHAMILSMYNMGELPTLGGLGRYPTFVHVDTRPGPGLVQWSK